MVWMPTGLYAVAGDVVTLTLPESLIGKAQVSSSYIINNPFHSYVLGVDWSSHRHPMGQR